MDNLYSHSKILTKENAQKVQKALVKAWSKETAFPESQKNWTQENKAFGQCAPTSLIINELFGGRIIYDKNNFHLWNQLPDGSEQDFSRSQFKEEKVFKIYKYKTKEEVLNDELGVKTDLLTRYRVLKTKFETEYKKLLKSS